MSDSKQLSRPLTQDALIAFLEDVELAFTAAFDTAPGLPRPVPAGYEVIRLVSMAESARTAAPLKPQAGAKSIHERRLQRLAAYYVRAAELSHCHAELAAQKTMTNKILELLCLGATTAISVLLKTWTGDSEALLVISGIVVTMVGGISSWCKCVQIWLIASTRPIRRTQRSATRGRAPRASRLRPSVR